MAKHQLHFSIFFLPFTHFIAVKNLMGLSQGSIPILFLAVFLRRGKAGFGEKRQGGILSDSEIYQPFFQKLPRGLLPDGGIGFGLPQTDNIGLSVCNGFRGDGAKNQMLQ